MVPMFVPTTVTSTPSQGKSHFSFTIAAMHPLSRGSVHISSTDPLTLPTINLSWADNDYDIGVLVEGVKLARRLIQEDSLAAIQARELAPGPSIQTDDQIADFGRQNAGTVFHPLGTAAMLPREKGGVVDHKLRVYGTENLRVVRSAPV
jgi:choline dehydrogenase-like flavoprotein